VIAVKPELSIGDVQESPCGRSRAPLYAAAGYTAENARFRLLESERSIAGSRSSAPYVSRIGLPRLPSKVDHQ
jgi:hypothetical protein